MGIQIVKVASHLPDHAFTNEDFEKILDTSDTWIQERTGIQKRYFVQEEGLQDLVVKAVRNLHLTERQKQKIKMIIVATCTVKYGLPPLASQIQEELFTHEDIFALDINMACSGFVAGLNVINSMLKEEEYGLLVGAEMFSPLLDFTDRNTAILFGDGSGAALIAKSNKEAFFTAGTKGNAQVLNYDRKLQMQGREVFKFAITTVPKKIKEFLANIGVDIKAIDYFICHQANIRIIEAMAKTLRVSSDKFPTNLYKTGNLSAASIPVLLADLETYTPLCRGDKLVFVGFGSGLNWSLAYLEW